MGADAKLGRLGGEDVGVGGVYGGISSFVDSGEHGLPRLRGSELGEGNSLGRRLLVDVGGIWEASMEKGHELG